MRNLMKSLLLLSVLLSTSLVSAKEVVVLFKEALSQESLEKALGSKNVKKIKKFYQIEDEYFSRLYSVEVEDEDSAIEELKKVQELENVEGIHKVEAFSIRPNRRSEQLTTDPLLAYQWGHFNQKQTILKDIDDIHYDRIIGDEGIDVGWKSIYQDIDSKMQKDIVVAVVDSGLDTKHPDLKGVIFKNQQECDENGQPILEGDSDVVPDNDENKLHGDCMGWNFTAPIEKPEARNVRDDIGHGTHVAGIIAAAKDNGQGISGFSKKIKILPVKVLSGSDSSGGHPISMTDRLARGILYAINMKVDVINLSLGWPKSIDTEYLKNAVSLAVRKGITVVAAAGNNNTNAQIFPCSNHHVICVGAIQNDGKMASFSNYGGYVDLLAPGDNILSLYPQRFTPVMFSVIGYEIKNGTSQASPYVAAAAAILKGVLGDISEDELKARLYESSGVKPSNVNPDKGSLHGLINIKSALEVEPKASVKPIFKEMMQIAYTEKDLKTKFGLRIKNYWAKAEQIKVHLEMLSEGFSFDRTEYTIPALEPGQSVLLAVDGKVADSNKDRLFKFKVEITVGEGAKKSYELMVPVVRLINGDQKVIEKRFELKDENHRLASIRNGILFPNLATVTDPYLQGENPVYFLKRSIKDTANDGIHLYFFDVKEDKIAEREKSLFIKGAKQILSLIRMDFNYDQKLDYLVRSIVVEGEKQHIEYAFYDEGLNPLYGDDSVWKFKPEVVIENATTIRYMPFKFGNHGNVAIPVFSEIGKIPSANQELSVWSRPDNSQLSRVYYLEPKKGEEGVELITKIIDDKAFMENLRKDLNLFWNDQIAVVSSLNQSLAEFYRGEVKVYLSIGKNYMRTNHLMTIKGSDKVEVVSLDMGSSRVEQNLLYPLTLLENGKTHKHWADTFIGWATNQSVKVDHMKSKFDGSQRIGSGVYHTQQTYTDHVLGYLAGYFDGESFFGFFQTKSNLLLVKSDAQGAHQGIERPISRFSFLPGRVLNDLFYPIVSGYEEKLRPTFFIDSTQITGNRIHALVAKGEEIISPLKYSLLIPNNCKAMNPVPMGGKGHYSYVMLCKYNGANWSLRTLELN